MDVDTSGKGETTAHPHGVVDVIDTSATSGRDHPVTSTDDGLDLKARRTYDASTYLSKQEAGAIVGLNPKTIERAILRGELRAYKPAGRVRIHRDDLKAWIAASVVEPSIHDI